jgi:FeS assembly SUF system protein
MMSSQPNNEAQRVIPLADAPPAPGPAADTVEIVEIVETVETAAPAPPGTPPGHPNAAAALGTPPAAFTPDPLNSLKFRPAIAEQLAKVFDPEIPVNIYELGLVYDIDVDNAANVNIRMTLTAPACPAAQTIPLDVERRVKEIDGINQVKVDIVWDPPWTKDRMSETAKLALGML